MRQKRFSDFLKLLNVDSSNTILDVGGTSEIWIGSGMERMVTLLNLTSPKREDDERGFTSVQGNALNMSMFETNKFDVVFSNSVIEHVSNFQNQKKFALEVQRVGKSYWVQTPNKYFPIEPHFLFPFFQFLPEFAQKWIALNWRYSHLQRWDLNDGRILEELSKIRLLTSSEMRMLFQGARLYNEKTAGLVKSIAAYKPYMDES